VRFFSDEFLAEADALFRRISPHVTDEDLLAALDSSQCADACESASQPKPKGKRQSTARALLRARNRHKGKG